MSPDSISIYTHKLDRLDVPGQGGWWKFRWIWDSPEKRRDEFCRLLSRRNHNDPQTIPKLRTLVDIGLWNDFSAGDKRFAGFRRRGVMEQVRDIAASVFGPASLADVLREPEDDARRMFSSVEWAKPVPLELLHLMIEAGLDPDTRVENFFNTPLMALMADNGAHEHVLLLMRAGANPRAQENPSNTAAHFLVRNGSDRDIQTLREMVAMGLDVNDPGMKSQTGPNGPMMPPACMAVSNGNMAMLEALVDMGARLDWPGHTAFHCAPGPGKSISEDQSRQIMEALLGWGAKIDEPDGVGLTPLWRCVPNHPDKALWLIERGARLELRAEGKDRGGGLRAEPKTLLEKIITQGASLHAWSDVVEAIEARQPHCWGHKCSQAVKGAGNIAELAMLRGDAWTAKASAVLLAGQTAGTESGLPAHNRARAPRF